jgi:hypothetical protein
MTGYSAGNQRWDAAPAGWSRKAQELQQKTLGSPQTSPVKGVEKAPRAEPWRLPLTATAPEKPYRLTKWEKK